MAKLKDGTTVYGDATVQKTLTVGNIAITGNLIVSGTTTTVDSTVSTIKDPVITLGGTANGGPAINDGKERGLILKYNDGTAQNGFMGWDHTNSQFAFASTTSFDSANNTVSITTYGDLRANVFFGDGGGLSNIVGANVTGTVSSASSATVAGTVTSSAQSNITSLGNLTGLQIGNATTTGNVVIDTNGNIAATGSISANGDLVIGTSVANNSVANIYGDLNVTGNLNGRFTGTIGAKGSNTQIQFNDSGTQNATAGFTFTKSSNTVGIDKVSIAGTDGNITVTGTAGLIGTTGVAVKATTGAINLTASSKDFTVDSSGISYNNKFNVNSDGNLTVYGYANIASNISAAGGDFTVSTTGNVDAKRGNFTSLKDTGLTDNQLIFTSSSVLGGSSGLTYSSNTLNANNFATTGDASISGNITTKYTAGKLLSTDITGNLIESNVQFSSDTLSVTNVTVSDTANIGNLKITGLTTTGALLYTSGATGAVTEDSGLTYSANTLTANNVTTVGTTQTANLKITSLTTNEVPYSDSTGKIFGTASFTYTPSTSTLAANNVTATQKITATGNIQGGNVIADNLINTSVVYAGTGGILESDSGFNYSSNTVTANNFTAIGTISGANVKSTHLINTGIVFTGTGGVLESDSGFTYTSNTLTANNFSSAGSIYANSGTVGASLLTGTLTTASQPNVTSVGTLTGLSISGGNLSIDSAHGIKTDNLYYSNGTAWDLQQAAGSNNYVQYNSDNNFAASSNFTFDPSAVSSTGKLTVTGQVDTGLVTATTGNITTVNSTNVFATTGNITTVNSTTVVATTGNITTVNAANIEASGHANITGYLKAGDTTITGNLTVSGTTTSVNTTVSQLSDPIIELGAGANGAALITADGMDRGLLLHTYSMGGAVDVFMGYKDDTDEFVFAKNVTVSNNVVNFGANASQQQANLADLRLGNIFAYNANFGGVVFSQGNVTLGSGSYFNGNVNGNISGNITVSGTEGALQFASSANALTSTSNLNYNAANVTLTIGNGSTTGKVIANLLTGTLTTASQPNITSVGTLGNLNVGTTLDIATGAVVANAGGIYTNGYYYANGDQIDFQTAAGSSFELQYHADGTNDLAASSKLTFEPTAGNLTVNGNIVTGTGSGGNISGADYVNANFFTGVLTTAGQPNITSVGTLSSLSVTGNITSTTGNIVAGTIGNSSTMLYGNGHNITNVTASSMDANNLTGTTLASSVVTSSLTSVGTLTSLTVNAPAGAGIITADSVYANTGTIGAAYLKGDGYQIANVTGANVTGYVPNANIANVAYAVGAGNITGTALSSTVVTSSLTTVGTLGNLTVTGNITSTTGNVLAGNIGNATTMLYGNGVNITGVTASSMNANNLTGTTLASSVVTSSLTTVGTLGNLTVDGQTDLGPVGNVKVTGGTSGQYLQTNGSGVLSWSTVELSNIHNGTSNVAVASSGNVTVGIAGSDSVITVATTGLTVTGIINASGNIVGNNITSNNFLTVSGTTDATSAITGAIHTEGGISAKGNIYAGHAIGFANGSGGTTNSAAFIQYNSTAGSLDFIFN